MSRRFTLAEAESLLPELGRHLREAIAGKEDYDRADEAIDAMTQRVMMQGGMVVDRDKAVDMRAQRDRAGERIGEALRAVQETGCEIKDLAIGLVDFPTMFEGEEVCLCWKLGEPRIEFWHGAHEGFAGRKPIDRHFIEQHRGNPTQ